MRLAPLCRADPDQAKASLDSLEGPSGPQDLYLEQLKSGGHAPGKQGKTWPWTKSEEDEVQVLEVSWRFYKYLKWEGYKQCCGSALTEFGERGSGFLIPDNKNKIKIFLKTSFYF